MLHLLSTQHRNQRGLNRISNSAIVIIITLWSIEIVATLLYVFEVVDYYEYWNPLTCLGYWKLVITLIKYTPPAYWNFKRKSTKGWSIFNIILDLTGGLFSFGQMAAEALYGMTV